MQNKAPISLSQHPWLKYLYEIHVRFMLLDGIIQTAPTRGNVCPTARGGFWCLLFDVGIWTQARILRIANVLTFIVYVVVCLQASSPEQDVIPRSQFWLYMLYGIVGTLGTPIFYEFMVASKGFARNWFVRTILVFSPCLGYFYTMTIATLVVFLLALAILFILVGLIIAGIWKLVSRHKNFLTLLKRALEILGTVFSVSFVFGVIVFLVWGAYAQEQTYPGFWWNFTKLSFGAGFLLIASATVIVLGIAGIMKLKFMRKFRAWVKVKWDKLYKMLCREYVA